MAMLECRLSLDQTDQSDRILQCPVCLSPDDPNDARFTHVVGVHMDRSGYNGRMNVIVEVECESGHYFEVIFHQHRGQTFLGVDGVSLAITK